MYSPERVIALSKSLILLIAIFALWLFISYINNKAKEEKPVDGDNRIDDDNIVNDDVVRTGVIV